MTRGNLPVSGRPTIWITVGQGSTALEVGAGEGCLDIFTLDYPFSPSLYGPILTEILPQRAVRPKTTNQPTNSQPLNFTTFRPTAFLKKYRNLQSKT